MSIFVHFADAPEIEVSVPEDFWSLSFLYRDEFVRGLHPTAIWFTSGPGDGWLLKQWL